MSFKSKGNSHHIISYGLSLLSQPTLSGSRLSIFPIYLPSMLNIAYIYGGPDHSPKSMTDTREITGFCFVIIKVTLKVGSKGSSHPKISYGMSLSSQLTISGSKLSKSPIYDYGPNWRDYLRLASHIFVVFSRESATLYALSVQPTVWLYTNGQSDPPSDM